MNNSVRRPPWWVLASAVAAPVFLIGGWQLAQARQPGFSPVRETISALAREGLDHRWIMTLGLAGLGVAHVVTALGLPGLRWWSRTVLVAAGVATALVAAFPQPFTGSSDAHSLCATIGFVTLVAWPATTATRTGPWTRRPAVAATVSVVSAALLIWFALTLDTDTVGLSERVLTAQQALWPLVVVVSLWRRTGPRADDDRIAR